MAITEYFIQLYPYTQNTWDLDEFRSLSHPDCQFCSSTISSTEGLRSRAERVEGGGVTFEDASALEVDIGRWFHVTLTMHEAPSRVVNEFGTVIEDSPERKTYQIDAVALFENSKWSIRGLSYERVSSG